ncbi:hypothetical protein CMK11_12750 [Candidatus Poribacteria bacterium]|nr:hypothetical protein [Candidatus Poribacteria bacterium]
MPVEMAAERTRAIAAPLQDGATPTNDLPGELRDIEATTYTLAVAARIGPYIARKGFFPVTLTGLLGERGATGAIRAQPGERAPVEVGDVPAHVQYGVIDGTPVRQSIVLSDVPAVRVLPTEWTRSRRLVANPGRTTAAAFVGRGIVTAGIYGWLHAWDPDTRLDMRSSESAGDAFALVASADGSRWATARRNAVMLWDGETGQHLRTFPSRAKVAGGLALSADGSLLAFRGDAFAATVFDADTGDTVAAYRETARTAGGVALSPDGTLLAAAKADGTVGVWDIAAATRLRLLTGHEGRVRAIVFTSDAKRLITGSEDGTIRVWDATTGAEASVLRGHEKRVTMLSLSADDRRVLSRSADKTVRLWDVASGDTIYIHQDNTGFPGASLSADGQRAALLTSNPGLRVVEAASGRSDPLFDAEPRSLHHIAVTHDGAFVACAGLGEPRGWSTATGLATECERVRPPGDAPETDGALRVRYVVRDSCFVTGLIATLTGEASLPVTHSLALGRAEDGTLLVSDAASGATLHALPEALEARAALSGDGATLAVASWSGSVDVWQLDIVGASATPRP